MRKRLSSLGSAFGISLAFVCCAAARPVTTEDLAGRTICYNNGMKATYFSDGKLENSMTGKGTWKVVPDGVQINAERYSGLEDFEISPDRTISVAAFGLIGNDCK